VECHD